jgi:hypothetical protein
MTRIAALVALTLSATYVGVWAAFFPHSFYRDFPGFGRVWVAVDGPYNEHLVRDVGGLYLAMAVLGLGALVWRDARLQVLAGACWTVFSLSHFAYHLGHLGSLAQFDKAANVVTLGLTLGAALYLAVPPGAVRLAKPGSKDTAEHP